MGYVNKKSAGIKEKAHMNFMSGPSYELTPLTALRVAASSCFFGEPMYYHRDKTDKRPRRTGFGSRSRDSQRYLSDSSVVRLTKCLEAISPTEWRSKTPAELLEYAIDKALDFDAEATLKFAVELRNEYYIRVTPQVILVKAAMHDKVKGTGWIRKYAKDIIKRADEPATVVAYYISKHGSKKNFPVALKRALKDTLEGYKDYHLAKYRMENRVVKTVDAVRISHATSDSISKLMKGELKLKEDTWESIISLEGSTKEAWTKAVDKMGHMALLRNIRNLVKAGVSEKVWLQKLIDGSETGMQLPFRYFSAYNANSDAPASVQDAIETCLEKSLKNLPYFKGKVMSLVDNSGSTGGTPISSMSGVKVNQIGNLMGVLTSKVSDDGYVGVFGDRLEVKTIRKKSSVFDSHKEVNQLGKTIGGGTEHGIWLFWDKAIKEKQHWDNVFVYSDMQAGHGGLYGDGVPDKWQTGERYGDYIDVPKLISEYRNKVNKDVNVFLVQIAGYQDTIIPEFFKRTYILGGWSDKILHFAAEMIKLAEVGQEALSQ